MSKIPKIPRETIVLVSAIVGANLIGILSYSKAADSSGLCDGFSQMWQGSPSEPERGKPIGSYYDVRQKRDVPFYREGEAPAVQAQAETNALAYAPIQSVVAPVAHPAQPAARNGAAAPAPSVPPLSITDAEIDAAIAREREQPGAWVAENRLPNASEQADYQARRQSLLSPRGGI